MKSFLEKVLEVKKDLSETAFARVLGMNQKTVNLYMNGERKPSLEFVKNICTCFGVSADWLLGLRDGAAPGAGGNVTASGPGAIAAGPHASVQSGVPVCRGSGDQGDCSKCKLMLAHIREITGRG